MGDAFEKLAGLVGASVEAAPGQGPPRTRAEALALGLTRYYTGKPCKYGHVAERSARDKHCVECKRQCHAAQGAKDRYRQYRATPEYKERVRQYVALPERKEANRQQKMKRAGDAALFAISQAERAAARAVAPADIVPQCPEPHRSQLQALIDRIRAEPTAGKAVVSLLRTMRDLRKTELAQQRADTETTAAESTK